MQQEGFQNPPEERVGVSVTLLQQGVIKPIDVLEELKEGRCRLDSRKKFFTMVVRPWPRLPREAVAAPSLAVFKARLDGALSSLVWWKVSLPMAGAWNEMILKVPSIPNHSVILSCILGVMETKPG